MLQEKDRQKLDSIVQQMQQNNESDENIGLVVNDFKSKYGGVVESKPSFKIIGSPNAPKTELSLVGQNVVGTAKGVASGIATGVSAITAPIRDLTATATNLYRGVKSKIKGESTYQRQVTPSEKTQKAIEQTFAPTPEQESGFQAGEFMSNVGIPGKAPTAYHNPIVKTILDRAEVKSDMRAIKKDVKLKQQSNSIIASSLIGGKNKTRTDIDPITGEKYTKSTIEILKPNIERVMSNIDEVTANKIASSKNPIADLDKFVQSERTFWGGHKNEILKNFQDIKLSGDEIADNMADILSKNKLYKDLLLEARDGNVKASSKLAEIDDEINFLRDKEYTTAEAANKVDIGNVKFAGTYEQKKILEALQSPYDQMIEKLKVDIFRDQLKQKLDPVTQGEWSKTREMQGSFEEVDKYLQIKKGKSDKHNAEIASMTRGEMITKQLKEAALGDITRPGKVLATATKGFIEAAGKTTSKENEAIKKAFKKLSNARLTIAETKEIGALRNEYKMAQFIEAMKVNDTQKLLPPGKTIYSPQFTESTIESLKNLRLTPSEVLNDGIAYQAFINELKRQPTTFNKIGEINKDEKTK